MSQQQFKGGAVRGPISEKNFFQIFLTSNPLGVILCGESIARIPEPWKCFLDPDSGKESVHWSENQQIL